MVQLKLILLRDSHIFHHKQILNVFKHSPFDRHVFISLFSGLGGAYCNLYHSNYLCACIITQGSFSSKTFQRKNVNLKSCCPIVFQKH